MLKRSIFALLAVIIVLLLAGCGAKTPAAPSEEAVVETEAPIISGENSGNLAVVEDSQEPSDTEGLTNEELTALAEKGDLWEISHAITTAEDAVRLLIAAGIKEGNSSDSEAVFTKKVLHAERIMHLVWRMLPGDYEEVGMVTTLPDRYHFLYVKQDGKYWAYDVLGAANSGMETGGVAFDSSEEMVDYAVKMRNGDIGTISLPTIPLFVPDTPEEKLAIYLTTPQYTKEQIDQWVAEGLTLEQWAEKIKVPADAIQMLNALGYKAGQYNDNIPFWAPDGTNWVAIANAQTVFDHRSGNCGGTSHIMNTLLAGDFDEQGYVEYTNNSGGHIFNYFVSDGMYAMCDFVDIFAGYEPYTYVVYIGSDIHEFGEKYLSSRSSYNDPDDEGYIYCMVMYPRDGAVKLPNGSNDQSEPTEFNNVIWDIHPAQYKELFTVVFKREGYLLRYLPIPDIDTWPAETR